MKDSTSSLERFFEALAGLTIWQRLFQWRRFRPRIFEAFKEYRSLEESAASRADETQSLSSRLSLATNELDRLRGTISSLSQELTVLRERDTRREVEVQSSVTALQAIRDQIAAERADERSAREEEARALSERMRNTWREHEQVVRERIKLICQRHTITYADVVPFHGSPDNAILFADEYVVFDAKSPAGDDLRNFPTYVKAQAEAARKYARQEKVRRDVYFVVPSQTLSSLQTFVYNFQDHDVFVISVDALEPIMLTLQRIEAYEFAEQLSPEERDDIIRIIARFTHMTKRRIQVDQFFDRQFLDLLAQAETGLPSDLLERVREAERTLKLNPPQDQRTKLLTTEELEQHEKGVLKEGTVRGIPPVMPDDQGKNEVS